MESSLVSVITFVSCHALSKPDVWAKGTAAQRSFLLQLHGWGSPSSLGFPVQLHRFLSEYLLCTQHGTQHSGSRGGSGGEGPAVPAPNDAQPSTELMSRITRAPVILPNAITQPTTHKRVNIWNGKICKDSMAEVTFKISPEVTNRSGNRVLQKKRIE